MKHGEENGILKHMKLRTIIVDNDPELLGQLKSILEEEKEAELLAAFSHPGELLAFVKENQVDLVFSDVDAGNQRHRAGGKAGADGTSAPGNFDVRYSGPVFKNMEYPGPGFYAKALYQKRCEGYAFPG